jgi:DNA-binding MarR family transcriptional regulator
MSQRNSQAPPLALERFLPYRLSVLTNLVSSAIAGAYAERFGLTIAEWRVMAVLGRDPGLSAAEVGDRTAMDKVAVSRAVARLTRARRVARKVARVDRRRCVLELTAAGRAVYGEIVPWALAYERRLLEALSPAEANRLDVMLAKLHARAATLGPVEAAVE